MGSWILSDDGERVVDADKIKYIAIEVPPSEDGQVLLPKVIAWLDSITSDGKPEWISLCHGTSDQCKAYIKNTILRRKI